MPRDSFHVSRLSGPELPVPDQAEDDPVTEITVDIPSVADEPIPPIEITPGEPPVRKPW